MSANDGNDYFVKFAETCAPQDQPSVAIEQIVAKLGRLIGAPTVDAKLLAVPSELLGQDLKPGVPITSAFVHASLALEHCDEADRPNLGSRAQDDNRRRHAGCYAIHDWFVGCDQQWLYDIDDDRRLYSHDHGLYLPPMGAGHWTEADLVAMVAQPHVLPDDPTGLLPAALQDVADALRGVTQEDIAVVLRQVPPSWPVTDQDLDALGWFLESRAPDVADRLEALSV